MTLTELRDRLSAIIEENESRGWSERNALPVYLEIRRRGKGRRVGSTYLPVEQASSSMMGLLNNDGCRINVAHLIGYESSAIHYGSKEHREMAKAVSLKEQG